MKFILSWWAIQNRPQNKPAHCQKETRRPDPAGRPASNSAAIQLESFETGKGQIPIFKISGCLPEIPEDKSIF